MLTNNLSKESSTPPPPPEKKTKKNGQKITMCMKKNMKGNFFLQDPPAPPNLTCFII